MESPTKKLAPRFVEFFFGKKDSLSVEVEARKKASEIYPYYVTYSKQTASGEYVRYYFVAVSDTEIKDWKASLK